MSKVYVYGNEKELKNYLQALNQCKAESYFGYDLNEEKHCDALLLAGGGDVHPQFYGQQNTESRNIDEQRDRAELALIQTFLNSERPILGICRGMQVLNVAFGGDLIQNIKNTQKHAYHAEAGDKVHNIECLPHSFLHTLYGEKCSVNSAHHQACGKAGENLIYSAFADDGIPEALAWQQKRIFAVQFHPERMGFALKRTDTVDGRLLIEFFLQQIML